jgi:hypothetical protein
LEEAIICHWWWMESKGLKKDRYGMSNLSNDVSGLS